MTSLIVAKSLSVPSTQLPSVDFCDTQGCCFPACRPVVGWDYFKWTFSASGPWKEHFHLMYFLFSLWIIEEVIEEFFVGEEGQKITWGQLISEAKDRQEEWIS